MGAVEIVLILVGVVFLMGSYFLPEKLSKKELDKIAELSENEIKHIVENKIGSAKVKIEDELDDAMEESYEKVLREMEKDSNEKIMAINEYSDSVLDSISKTHNEVMFLYSMLNDKYDEMTSFANDLSSLKSEIQMMQLEQQPIRDSKTTVDKSNESVAEDTNQNVTKPVLEDDSERQKVSNEQIIALHLQGKEPVEIAKELGVGIGVVRLVLGLYKGE